MRQFVYILILLFVIGCSNNTSKDFNLKESETVSTAEENIAISEEDAYILLITQKLEEELDKKLLIKEHPDFTIKTSGSISETIEGVSVLQKIELIDSFKKISDSVKIAKTKVVFDTKTDTILTYIKTSKVEIDGEIINTIKVSFDKGLKTP
ncbi:hypothetical protein [Aquimarina sp. 2201CG5-10]|uniref:hypothetical protein n=1 Tax=Aquimarina callyspongiae TaxID=3098150 RepID=UPI002AB5A143|nr:hypothetical protein [Aquimarina sp. 2201CG5-10]MDY8134514.1 hypothetical protein [Aquimarina sp. 2201CG5-10]